jgi:hypothetical protein
VTFGGIEVRRVPLLAISAYLASAASTLELRNSLLADSHAFADFTVHTPAFGKMISNQAHCFPAAGSWKTMTLGSVTD